VTHQKPTGTTLPDPPSPGMSHAYADYRDWNAYVRDLLGVIANLDGLVDDLRCDVAFWKERVQTSTPDVDPDGHHLHNLRIWPATDGRCIWVGCDGPADCREVHGYKIGTK